jgi:hypothetical protein
MVSDEFAMLVHNPGGGLADNDEAHHYRLLGALIGKEILLAHSIDETASIVFIGMPLRFPPSIPPDQRERERVKHRKTSN